MLYVKPDYFDKFACVADRCEATCCAGWQIVIDEEACDRYQSEPGEYGAVLRERIDWEEGVFKQGCGKRCAFLKENNLCEMYERLGEDSLCFTCTNYPRHIEEFGNLREITLAVSCPEVARILLEQKNPVRFEEEEIDEKEEINEEEIGEKEIEEEIDEEVEIDGEEDNDDEEIDEEAFEDFDPFYFSYLEDARKIMIALLQNRELPVAVRMALVRKMADEMQDIIEESELYNLVDVFDIYEEEDSLREAIRNTEQELKGFYEDKENGFRYSKGVFELLFELEFLSEDWENYLNRCKQTLYGEGIEAYYELQKGFQEYCAQTCFDGVSMDIILEQLAVYFVFAYFCGAVYDDNVIGKVKMAADSITVLCEMFVAKWAEQDGTLSAKDIQKIVYRYSRELEHSDVNLEVMQNV